MNDFECYDTPQEYLFMSVLKGCGCGTSSIKDDVWEVFEKIVLKDAGILETLWNDKYKEFIAHMLDGAKLIEHGSSIAGVWATQHGEDLYRELVQYYGIAPHSPTGTDLPQNTQNSGGGEV